MFHEENVTMRKKIAITGGIGSGKSTVLNLLRNAGYCCFSCDEIYNDLIKDEGYVRKIQSLFPDVVIQGVIDRVRLSEIVFKNTAARKQLNELAHAQIMLRLYNEMNTASALLVFAEIPLLFEGNYQNEFDGVIVVMRDKSTRVNAVCDRDKATKESVEARINAQYDYSALLQNIENFDVPIYIIENNANYDTLASQVLSIVKQFS